MSDSVRDLRGGNWAWFSKDLLRMNLGWKANLAYMGIVFFVNNDTQSCFPSLKKLSEQVGTSKDTIIRGIKDLETAGLLRVDRRIDEGNNQSSVYNLLPIPVANSDKGTANSVGVVAHSDKGCRSQRQGVVAHSDTNKNDFEKEYDEHENSMFVLTGKTSEKPVTANKADPRYVVFLDDLNRYWKQLPTHSDKPLPMDAAGGKNLKQWLRDHPHIDEPEFWHWLENMYASENANPAWNVRDILTRIHRYADGPLNAFGKPLNGTPR